ncbi:hypothetical protein DFQ27_001935 [Actinomortierella ambigua]|uniref:Uncharacterized protein n=1 Tax=Actinomortierella ambigua TaxID=1343610 RepID=A0A9P6QMD6_9FUNG|nr:hypothetical protein DFQ27_001935 [Actinomortierella ambigua]
MTSVHSYPSSQGFVKQPSNGGHTPSINGWSSGSPRKNSMMMPNGQAPVLSSFAIDLIAQFDAYRTNMRETLRREVEENMQKAKALKEALKDASGLEAEQALQREQEELEREELLARVKALGSRTSLDSDKSGKSNNTGKSSKSGKSGKSGKSPKLKGVLTSSSSSSHNNTAANGAGGGASSAQPEKKSRLERIFGKKAFNSSTNNNNNKSPATLPGSTSRGGGGAGARPLRDQAQANSNGSTTLANNSSTDLADLRYLPVDEENEEMYLDEAEIQITDRSMNTVAGAGGQADAGDAETQVKLHPTRAKVFSLPKSIRNLKRRIAALRAKGVDINKDQQGDASAQDQGDKKKFRLIRLLPWKSSSTPKKSASTPATGLNRA